MARAEVIAHRGASAYAPENTMPAFALAHTQEAGCVELDLQLTKDGELVCVHDVTLERTTNVRQVFPGRARHVRHHGAMASRWFVPDFTLAEIRALDAGSWFGSAFAETRVPTFDEVLAWARGRVAVLCELKDPDVYEAGGADLLGAWAATVRRHGVLQRPTDLALAVQSFDEPTVRAAAQVSRWIPAVLLVEPADAPSLTRDRVMALAEFASGIGPEKSILCDQPEIVEWAHGAGLRVTPWTFRTATVGAFDNVTDEMAHYLGSLGVDAVITDHPDRAPRDCQSSC